MLSALFALPAAGQWPFPVPATPGAQRNALAAVRAEAKRVDNAARVAPNYGAQGWGNVWQSFQGLRQAYSALKSTMDPRQLAAGANELAELDVGLDIIQEAFANYQENLAAGQPERMAVRSLCRVVQEGSALWLQELNKVCGRLHVGWGA